MNARSALFDLYGDHLRAARRPGAGRRRWSACWRRSASPRPAVRTAVSRMVRQGWLEPVRLPDGPGYALTPRAARRLDDAPPASTGPRHRGWDGTLAPRGHRPARRAQPPRPGARRPDVPRLRAARRRRPGSARAGPPRSTRCSSSRGCAPSGSRPGTTATRSGSSAGPGTSRAWPGPTRAGSPTPSRWCVGAATEPADEQAFAVRSRLVHEWRKFLFLDPGLPRELLPGDWPGDKAAGFFDTESDRLLPRGRALRRQLPDRHRPDRRLPGSLHVERHRPVRPRPTASPPSRSTARTR